MKKFILIFSFIILQANAPFQQQELIAPEPPSGFQYKPHLEAQNYMVVSAHRLATEAGYKILQKGGNAVDAAIATQLVLNVVEPHASGIGGGGFLVYYDHKKKRSKYYDGRETAPANIKTDLFLDEQGREKDFREVLHGGISVGTPGLLKLLYQAHLEHGKLPWFELFSDAIDTASLGFYVSPRLNEVMYYAPHLAEFTASKDLYLDEKSRPKVANTFIKNPELAQSFRNIAINGIEDFYRGKLAKEIVKTVRNTKQNPGYLTVADLENYQINTGGLLCSKYRKYKVCSVPMPSSGGATLLQILGILENFDLSQMEFDSLEAIHLVSEAMRLAYADRNKYMADDKFVNVPLKKLLSKSYLKERSYLINVDAALLNVKPGDLARLPQEYAYHESIFEPPSTTHLSIVDGEGNAVALTSSIEYAFGSGVMVGGFLLNNQLTDFAFKQEKNGLPIANRIEPGKRPRSSMAPTMVFDEKGRLVMILGSPGGARIISYLTKTILAVLDWNMPLDEAVNLPNYNKMGASLELEKKSYIEDYRNSLEQIGHNVAIKDLTSGLHGIYIDQPDGEQPRRIVAGVDKRREGVALGD